MSLGSLIVRIGADLTDLNRSLSKADRDIVRVGKSMQHTGTQMTKYLTVPIVAAGAALLKVGADFEAGLATIRTGTGKTGAALEALDRDMKAVLATVPQGVGDVSTAIADLNTRLGLTGEPLQAMAKQMLDLARVTGRDVATVIASTTRVFGDWSVETENQTAALDMLFKAGQATGIGVDRLAQSLVQFGAPLRQMGFDLEESTALLGQWEKEGVNTEAILGALKIGVANFARAGVDARDGLQQFIAQVMELGEGAAATSLAVETFGSRAGPDMVAAVLEGRLALDDMIATIHESGDTIDAAAADAMKFSERLALLRNRVYLAAEPLAADMIPAAERLTDRLVGLVDGLGRAVRWFGELPQPIKTTTVVLVGLAAAAGPVLVVMGKLLVLLPSLKLAFIALTGPIGLVVAAIGVLTFAAVTLVRNWDVVRLQMTLIWAAIKDAVFSAVDGILGVLEKLVAWIPKVGDKVRGLRADFDRFATDSLAKSGRAIYEQEMALASVGAEMADTSRATGELARITDQMTAAATGLASATDAAASATNGLAAESDVAANALDGQNSALQRLRAEMAKGMPTPDFGAAPELPAAAGAGVDPGESLGARVGQVIQAGAGGQMAQMAQAFASFGPLAAVLPIISGAMERLRPILESLLEPLIEIGHLVGEMLTPIFEALREPLKALAELVKALIQPLGPLINLLVAYITPALRGLSWVARALAVAFSYVQQAMGWFVRGIGDLLQRLLFWRDSKWARRLQTYGQELIDGAKATRANTDVVDEFADAVADAADTVTDGLTEGADVVDHFSASVADATAEMTRTARALNAPRGLRLSLLRWQASVAGMADNHPVGPPPREPLPLPLPLPVLPAPTVTMHVTFEEGAFAGSGDTGDTDARGLVNRIVSELDRQARAGRYHAVLRGAN